MSGDVPPHLAQPCCVALGRALIWGLYPDWFEGLVNWLFNMHSLKIFSMIKVVYLREINITYLKNKGTVLLSYALCTKSNERTHYYSNTEPFNNQMTLDH